MSPKILVLSAAVGAGHLRAAEAVELALRQIAPAAEVRNVDLLTMTNAMFRRVYGTAYLDMVNKLPHVLGYFYDYMDQAPSPQHKTDRLRKMVQRLNLGTFLKFLRSQPWSAVVSTHFLPAELIAGLKEQGEFSPPQLTVTTDFETHRLWVNQPCEHYFTATQQGAIYLQHWGVPAETIQVTGIPIHPKFCEPLDRTECQKKHQILGNRPVILQLAGGFGVGPILQIYQAILRVETPVELIVVTGKNQELYEQLQADHDIGPHRVHILGYTTEMHELMCSADLVVTKPGGLTSSEALASGLGMVIVNPIPGQESRNSDYLLEQGAAIKANNMATLTYKLQELVQCPARMQKLQCQARQIAQPHAAFTVAEKVLEFAMLHEAQSLPTTAAH
ncbi:MAG: glycosyltransferase [Pirellulales bacterium]|nr:glycosyltransferase [Pirellulales bacterium]